MSDAALTPTASPASPGPGSQPGSQLGSPKGNTTRRRLLETAWGLFAAEGYGETTLRRIAQQAGVSLGLSYRYFATKEELVLALYHQILQDLEARAAELAPGSLAERFEALMQTKLALVAPHRRTLGTVLSHMLAPEHPLAALGDQTEAVRARGKAVFARAVLGASDAPADPAQAERLARGLYLIHLGLVMLSFLARDERQLISRRALELVRDLLGFATALLDSPLAGLFAARIDGLVDPLLNLSTGESQVLSERILGLILAHRRLPEQSACAEAPCPACLALHLPRIQYFIAQGLPVHLLLTGFGAKSPNPERVLGELPDLAEEQALLALQGLCDEISAIYPAGARLTICADGRVNADLLGIGDEAISRYGRALDQLIEKLGLPALERFSLEDLYDGQACEAARKQLSQSYAYPLGGERSADSQARQARCAVLRRELAAELPELRPAQAEALARALLQRGQAWSRLLGQCFPQALRLSARPEDPHADTIGIALSPAKGSADAWIAPWQGVALLGPEGWRLLPRSEAEALGARLIRRGRRPSHYSLLEPEAKA